MELPYAFKRLKEELISECGLTQNSYDVNWEDWKKDYGDSLNSWKDFIWNLYQLLLTEYAKVFSSEPKQMYEWHRIIYGQMLSFLIAEGKNKTVALRGLTICDLQLANLSLVKYKAVIIGNCCSECDAINGKYYPLKDMLQSSILPYSKCKRENGCICCYGFEAIRDENGKLLKK